MKLCIKIFEIFQQKKVVVVVCNDYDFLFCRFFKNNEHISYDYRLTKKTVRKKMVVAIVDFSLNNGIFPLKQRHLQRLQRQFFFF